MTTEKNPFTMVRGCGAYFVLFIPLSMHISSVEFLRLTEKSLLGWA